MPATWQRRELLESGRLRGLPQHGIGRPMKAGKEEIAGLLVALERYLARDEQAERRRWTEISEGLAVGARRRSRVSRPASSRSHRTAGRCPRRS